MKITFHGAARTVTGSQHLVDVNGKRILLDCGLYQGPRREAEKRNRNFPFDPKKVDAVVLSHAHIDHSGNLPNLVKSGYKGPIYATEATTHLTGVMLMDSGKIQEGDAEYLNRKLKPGQQPVEPLYTQQDAERVKGSMRSLRYEQTEEIAPGVQARLVEAGHILGSAAVVLDIDEGGRQVRLWFSGDIGRRNLPLLRDPMLPERPDLMIMECTYGDKPHRDPEQAYVELREVVRRTIERGGKVIVPAFAVGRTQELVYGLNQMFAAGEIPRVPVYVDSPLAVNVSDVFRRFPQYYDDETREFVGTDGKRSALGFEMLTYTRSVEESKALNDRKDPMVIISASGMAETGRILHHLKNNIEDPRNTVLIVSWQAPHTLGRRLADREERVKIFGEVYERRAEVATIGGLSAHAGQDLLVEYALRAKPTVKKVFLVHGEEKPAKCLQDLVEAKGMQKPAYPERGDSFQY